MSLTLERPRPRLDPRMRERRARVRRKQRRRRLRRSILAVLTVVLVVGVVVALRSPLLSARHVTVSGAHETPRSEILSVSGLLTHPPLIDVDPGRISARLGRLPWVAGSAVQKHWPDSLSIAVTERRAVAGVPVPGGSSVALVDESGRVLAYEKAAPPDIVTLSWSPSHGVFPRPGSNLPRATLGALQAASRLPPALAGSVKSVSPASGGSVDLGLTDGSTVTLGAPSDLRAKFVALASLLEGATPAAGSRIDVSLPSEPVVWPPSA